MEFFAPLWDYIIPFLLVLTILVFVHELGHFLVARWVGVRIETFSVGFGPELFGFTDRRGTRWKFSAVPLGGYVKMFGDANVASSPGGELSEMTAAERAQSFHHKTLMQRAAVVIAGPAANFLFAIVVAAGIYMTAGQPFTPPVVGTVLENSVAAEAGLRPGDRFVELAGSRIGRFEDIQRIVRMRPGEPLAARIDRDGDMLDMTITPGVDVRVDKFGNEHRFGLLGISRSGMDTVRLGPVRAVGQAVDHTAVMTGTILDVVGQMVVGSRSAQELGGVLRIGQISGEVAQVGVVALLNFMVLLSINLGLINLFPVPMLDGGHLVFYAIEAIRGRPLGERATEIAYRVGFALVVALMLFATWNDLVYFRVVDFFRQIVS